MTELTKRVVRVGEVVRYSNPQDRMERELRFVVREVNGDRVMIQLIGPETIKPVECVPIEEVVCAS